MAWLLLFIAGLSEVAWAVGLKYTDGFSKPYTLIFTLLCMVISFVLLSLSLRSLPLGVAYGVWVGIGAIGTAIAGSMLFGEELNLFKVISLGMIILGVIGLKITS